MEQLTISFIDHPESDSVESSVKWNFDSTDPLIIIEALRDLADAEERRYRTWLYRHYGELPGTVIKQY